MSNLGFTPLWFYFQNIVKYSYGLSVTMKNFDHSSIAKMKFGHFWIFQKCPKMKNPNKILKITTFSSASYHNALIFKTNVKITNA